MARHIGPSSAAGESPPSQACVIIAISLAAWPREPILKYPKAVDFKKARRPRSHRSVPRFRCRRAVALPQLMSSHIAAHVKDVAEEM